MVIERINSLNWESKTDLLKTLAIESSSDRSQAAQNLKWDLWEENSASVMHSLVIQKRYDPPNGLFMVVHIENIPVACSGCYLSDWSELIMVLGVRTWTNPKFRDSWWHGNLLLPEQISLAKNLNCVAAVFTFNNYSRTLKKLLFRITRGKATVFGEKNSEFYKNLIFLDGEFMIKNTKQTIAVKLLNITENEFRQRYLPPKF